MTTNRIGLPDGVAYEVVEGEAMVLQLSSGTYFRLNRTATFIFDTLVLTGDFPTVVKELTNEFEIDQATAERDSSGIVSQLQNFGLLVNRGPDSKS